MMSLHIFTCTHTQSGTRHNATAPPVDAPANKGYGDKNANAVTKIGLSMLRGAWPAVGAGFDDTSGMFATSASAAAAGAVIDGADDLRVGHSDPIVRDTAISFATVAVNVSSPEVCVIVIFSNTKLSLSPIALSRASGAFAERAEVRLLPENEAWATSLVSGKHGNKRVPRRDITSASHKCTVEDGPTRDVPWPSPDSPFLVRR